MTLKTFFRHSMVWLLTLSATLSIGFLAASGMLVMFPAFVWYGAASAFILAAAYESQVNGQGIEGALARMFDPNYLRLGIVKTYLDDLLMQESASHQENIFLHDYKAQKDYIEALEKYIESLEASRAARGWSMSKEEKEEREQFNQRLISTKKALRHANKQLRQFQLFFLKNVLASEEDSEEDSEKDLTSIKQAVRALMAEKKEELAAEMKRKAILLKAGWFLSIGGGISSGLATLSAIKVSIATFAFLSAIPGGAIFALCALAAVSYTFLIYQSMADMIQQYNSRKRASLFGRRVNKNGEMESKATQVLRCVGVILAIGLGIFATIATAGTWWYAAKQGAALLGAMEKVATVLRDITVSAMVVPTFIFNFHNSVESIDNMSRSDYKQLLTFARLAVKDAYQNENIIRFINPFRLLAYVAKPLLLIAHTLSIGVISSDRVGCVPANVSSPLYAGSELLTDLNYLPDVSNKEESHSHQSFLLRLLFLPISLVVGVLNGFAVVWDWLFSSPRDIKKSVQKIFDIATQTVNVKEPVAPTLSPAWRKLALIKVCEQDEKQLKNSSPVKVQAVKDIAPVKVKADKDITPVKAKAVEYTAPTNAKAAKDIAPAKVKAVKGIGPVKAKAVKDIGPAKTKAVEDIAPTHAKVVKAIAPAEAKAAKNLALAREKAAKDITQTVVNSGTSEVSRELLEENAISGAPNRHVFWKQPATSSEKRIQQTVDVCFNQPLRI